MLKMIANFEEQNGPNCRFLFSPIVGMVPRKWHYGVYFYLIDKYELLIVLENGCDFCFIEQGKSVSMTQYLKFISITICIL